jgi:hypothetical protein
MPLQRATRNVKWKEQSFSLKKSSKNSEKNVTSFPIIESEIEKKISKIFAETENKISEINNHINLAEKEANRQIASVENNIVVIK